MTNGDPTTTTAARVLRRTPLARLAGLPVMEIARFGVVGLAATAVHYLTALAALSVAPPLHANVIGFLTAVAVSWIGHSRWTFRAAAADGTGAGSAARLPRFVATVVGGFSMSQGTLWLVERFDALPDALALMVAVGVVPPTTYLLNKFWVFR
ncbi:GtrA family protein [Caenispirillum salinarum]|uniref:GtrA family protein n=1 Tax=Caenispirillum salinarum TaxID=859058 RepID=UPI00384ADC12